MKMQIQIQIHTQIQCNHRPRQRWPQILPRAGNRVGNCESCSGGACALPTLSLWCRLLSLGYVSFVRVIHFAKSGKYSLWKLRNMVRSVVLPKCWLLSLIYVSFVNSCFKFAHWAHSLIHLTLVSAPFSWHAHLYICLWSNAPFRSALVSKI